MVKPKSHLTKEEKVKFFSQQEAQQLSGLTVNQLRKLHEIGLVVPAKHPSILYNWNQMIFLRVYCCLREDWSVYQINKALEEHPLSIQEIIENIDKYLFAALGKTESNKIGFVLLHETFFGDELLAYKVRQMFSTESDFILENLKRLDKNSVILAPYKRKLNDFVAYAIPQIIHEIKKSAKEKQIENFDLKVG